MLKSKNLLKMIYIRFSSTYCSFSSQYFSYKLRNCTQNESVIPFDHPDALTEDQILFINYLELASLLPGILFTVVSIIITNMSVHEHETRWE